MQGHHHPRAPRPDGRSPYPGAPGPYGGALGPYGDARDPSGGPPLSQGGPPGPHRGTPGREPTRRPRLFSFLLTIGLVVSVIGLATGLPRLWQENLGPEAKVRPAPTSHPPAVTPEFMTGVVVLEAEADSEVYTGTGMVLTAQGEILTAYHVIENAHLARAIDPGTGAEYELELVGYNHERDIALLTTAAAAPLETVTIDTDGIVVGSGAVAIGNAEGQGYLSEFPGTITSVGDWTLVGMDDGSPPLRVTDLIGTDADIVSGFSGGPLLDGDGEVVGVVVIGSDPPDPDGYAVPITDALEIVADIRAGAEEDGTIIHATAALGIVTVNARENPRNASDIATRPFDGLQIVRFAEGSAAEWAGIEVGDVVTSLNGETILFASELAAMLRELNPKDMAVLGVVRGDDTHEEVRLRLGVRTRL